MTHANQLFEGVNHIVFTRLTDEKKTTSSNYVYFWSYGPISSYVWVLPPFMAMFLDHNSRTIDPNSMFPSIFHNVLRCLIHVNHQNKGLPLKIFQIFRKIAQFLTLMINRPNFWTRNGSRPLRSNTARKTCMDVAYFVFCRSNMSSLMGEH